MKLSVKSDYAVRAVLELARHYGAGVVRRVEELALEQGIPPNYLVQILLELKAKQLVRSVRGKDGGYLLARPPSQITMGDVLRAIHGRVFESPAQSDPKCPAELQAHPVRSMDQFFVLSLISCSNAFISSNSSV